MTTTFLLIRHAVNDLTGKVIYGRMPGVRLSAEGRRQAERLAEQLAPAPVRALYCSPLERAVETAEPIARRLGLRIEFSDELSEFECGDWTGCEIPALAELDAFRRFNTYRSGTRAPGGELMLESQVRIVRELERLRARHPDETVAVVSHGDVIRAAVMHYAGSPLDLFLRIEISPASVSAVSLDDDGPRILYLNLTCS